MPKNHSTRSRRAVATKATTENNPTARATAVKLKTIAPRPPATDRDARKAGLAATLDLKDLNDLERSFLATCQKIYRRDHGCVTPFEEFFWALVVRVGGDLWPTPADVEKELECFRDNFEDMDKWARVFVETYPASAEGAESREEGSHA